MFGLGQDGDSVNAHFCLSLHELTDVVLIKNFVGFFDLEHTHAAVDDYFVAVFAQLMLAQDALQLLAALFRNLAFELEHHGGLLCD